MTRQEAAKIVFEKLMVCFDKRPTPELAFEIVDALGCADIEPPEKDEEDMALGFRGVGIWLRQFDDLTPKQAAAALDFVVVALHSGERGRVNRSAVAKRWLEQYRGLGGRIWVMDWLPRPDQGTAHLGELCRNAAALGALGIMADLEPDAGWRHALEPARRYALKLQGEATTNRLKTAYTDYGRGGNSDPVMRALLGILDAGVPQSYDPHGSYVENYHERSVDYWRERGAKKVVLGVGLWLRSERRHRTPEEFERHLARIPPGVCGVVAWYAGERALHAILPSFRKWAPSTQRSILDNLTPFGSALHDELDDC